MNYKESQEIFEEIKKAKRIIINCHRSPDPDSVSSALSMSYVLSQLGKNDLTIISPDEIPGNCKFLEGSENIQITDFSKFDFSSFDLLILLDSGSWDQVTGGDNIQESGIHVVMIDHHDTNSSYGDIALLKQTASSTCEVLVKVYEDFGVKFDKSLSTILLTGMVGDTVFFQTEEVSTATLESAITLIKNGADRNNILFHLYKSKPLDEIQLMGEMLTRTLKDDQYRFAWTAIPKSISEKYPNSKDAKVFISNSFLQSVDETDFGIIMEEKDNYLSVSFRSRTDFDVSQIANALGGGGHKNAAATRVRDLPFDEAIEKVLEAARKYARKNLE